jgi:DNA-binding transcriptional ArsR family regulator
MRRNMDLARAILLELEQRPFTGSWHEIEIAGYTPEEISYHVRLLFEAGFIDATDSLDGMMGSSYSEWRAKTITWEGHEFLESSRDKTRWEKAKGVITEKGGAMTLDALKLVLSELIRKAVLSL